MRAEVASSGSILAALAKQRSARHHRLQGESAVCVEQGMAGLRCRVGDPLGAQLAATTIARPFSVAASGWPAADESAT